MLVVRNEQMAVLSRLAWAAFIERMERHLRESFPDVCTQLDERGLRTVIRESLEAAQCHGLTTERDFCRYLNLVFVFGRGFDRDQSWAREILASTVPAVAKASRLYAEGILRESTGRGLLAADHAS